MSSSPGMAGPTQARARARKRWLFYYGSLGFTVIEAEQARLKLRHYDVDGKPL